MLSGVLIAVQMICGASYEEPISLETLCERYPERVHGLFDALDLERGGLEAVRTAADARSWPEACRALLEYYQTSGTASWLRREPAKPGDGRDPGADAILADQFTFYQVSDQVPRRPDGGLDWAYNGPEGDREWGWGLNRMQWCNTLLGAYWKTGNLEYVRHYDRILRDWVLANPYPGAKSNTPQWRGLEVFMRVNGSWPAGFFGLQDVDAFMPATRILMLSSLPDHAHYARHFHAGGSNWIAMELLGLANVAVCWPEFKKSEAWLDYAIERMLPEVVNQVYPDGIQKELTSHYHRVSLYCFERFIERVGRAGREVPKPFKDTVERMHSYLAYSMRPSGYGVLNNDSNLDYTRPGVLTAANAFKRPDWAYIATNGKEGVKPDGLPSVVFPWAGQVVMRSGWDAEAHWAFFDVGPMGSGHRHNDKLHLSVTAHGRDILVDGGRYSYQAGDWRNYFVYSPSHNLILVDGHGQKPHPYKAEAAMTDNYLVTPELDFARGTFDSGYVGVAGEVAHTRAVVYVRGRYWVVVDRITTDRPRELQTLWHYHPDCTVELDGIAAASTDAGKGNIRIVPIGGVTWDASIVKGQTEPHIQGWWSIEYGIKEPSPCVVYKGSVDGDTVFGWILVPGKGTVAAPRLARLEADGDSGVRVEIGWDGAPDETIVVPWEGTGVQWR